MTKELIHYEKHYQVYIKWEEIPIEVSWEWWELIKNDLLSQWSWFIDIKGNLYNRFNIDKVLIHKQELDEYTFQAIQQAKQRKKEIQDIAKTI